MALFIGAAVLLLGATIYIVRRIVKLPSRYERQPRNLSPWNALDQGIDPSTSEKPNL